MVQKSRPVLKYILFENGDIIRRSNQIVLGYSVPKKLSSDEDLRFTKTCRASKQDVFVDEFLGEIGSVSEAM